MDGLYDQARITIHSIWRRRWIALGVAWAFCGLGWLALAFVPNVYESRARLFIQPQQLLPNALDAAPTDRAADLFRVRQALTSSDALEKVVRRTDLNSLVTSERALVDQIDALCKRIKIMATPDNLIEISTSASVSDLSDAQNARLAGATVQALVDVLIEDSAAGDRQSAQGALALVDEQLRSREAALQQTEQRRVDFEQRFLGSLPGDGTVADRVTAAQREIAEIEQQLMIAQSSLQSLRAQMSATPSAIGGGAGAGGAMSGQVAALEAQLAQGRARGWTDQHPDMIATRSEIARLKPQANAERRSGGSGGTLNPAYASLRALVSEKEAQIAGASARRDQLQNAIRQLNARQTSHPDSMAEQARLDRDHDVLKRQYDKLLEDREQIRLRGDVAAKTEPLQFRVVEPASRPSGPASPNRPLLLTAVLILGVGAGIGAAFILGQLQTTFPTQERLTAAIGLPMLGSISEVVTDTRRARRARQLRRFAGAGGALVAGYALILASALWQAGGGA